jgi:hypothetical protein
MRRAGRIGLVALAAIAVAVPTACNRRPSPTINDPAFVRQANALCARELPKLRPERKESNIFGPTPKTDREATALRVEHVADELDRIADELGALPVRAQDQGEVAGWLEEWANFTGIGRQYAAAIRTRKASVYTSIAAEGNGPVQRIGHFARANKIDSCVL